MLHHTHIHLNKKSKSVTEHMIPKTACILLLEVSDRLQVNKDQAKLLGSKVHWGARRPWPRFLGQDSPDKTVSRLTVFRWMHTEKANKKKSGYRRHF